MIVYIGAGSGKFRDFVQSYGHGQMVARQSFRVPRKARWAFDNGAYTDFKRKKPFNDKEFMRLVNRIESLPDELLPDWCVCPDALHDRRSVAYSVEWKALLSKKAPRIKWYLVLQDYVHPDDIQYAMELVGFDGLFIGSENDKWRMDTAPGFVELGHQLGIPVHIGRINGKNRLQWAVDIGADSVDGTGWVWAWYGGPKRKKDWLEALVNVPTPQRVLLPADKEIREEWLKFGDYLRKIYETPEEWAARIPEDIAEDPHYERYQRIWEMDPEEFVYWLTIAYPDHYGGQQDWLLEEAKRFKRKKDFKEWKMAILDEAERFVGPRPVPPGLLAGLQG